MSPDGEAFSCDLQSPPEPKQRHTFTLGVSTFLFWQTALQHSVCVCVCSSLSHARCCECVPHMLSDVCVCVHRKYTHQRGRRRCCCCCCRSSFARRRRLAKLSSRRYCVVVRATRRRRYEQLAAQSAEKSNDQV